MRFIISYWVSPDPKELSNLKAQVGSSFKDSNFFIGDRMRPLTVLAFKTGKAPVGC